MASARAAFRGSWSCRMRANACTVTVFNTRLTKLLGIRYPIIQTGMGWVANPRLAAATSQAGGLGILGSATMTLDEVRRSLDEIRSLTDAPFGVNFRSDNPDADRVVDLLIERGVRVASSGGAPRRDLVEKLKAAGVVNLPTVGAVRHAQKVVEWGVDAVVVQGAEGAATQATCQRRCWCHRSWMPSTCP